jgi:DNA-binding response OmpR family regulator
MKRLLVVDDDPTVANLVTKALAASDRVIRQAADGAAALHWISKETFDLVICDLMMPRGHGFEVIKSLRANPEASATRILILTAKSFSRDADKALASGADMVITKPFEVTDLKAKVNQLLS